MIQINLTNAKEDASIERYAYVEFQFCGSAKNGQMVILTVHVEHRKEGEQTAHPLIPNKEYTFVANNSTLVDAATGIPVEEGSSVETIGEYDFFVSLLSQPVVLQDLIVGKIQYLQHTQRI